VTFKAYYDANNSYEGTCTVIGGGSDVQTVQLELASDDTSDFITGVYRMQLLAVIDTRPMTLVLASMIVKDDVTTS